jgi:gas vesicle protein
MSATWTHRDDGFVNGLLTGACVGAGVAIWLAPRLASVLRRRVFDSAGNLGQPAAEQYQHVGTHVGEAVDELVRRAQSGRDDVVDAVACEAHDVEGFATDVHSGRVIAGGTYSHADRRASTRRAL